MTSISLTPQANYAIGAAETRNQANAFSSSSKSSPGLSKHVDVMP